jgi:hypothetical protein
LKIFYLLESKAESKGSLKKRLSTFQTVQYEKIILS